MTFWIVAVYDSAIIVKLRTNLIKNRKLYKDRQTARNF